MVIDWLKRLRQEWWRRTPRVRTSQRHGGATIPACVQPLEPRVLLSAAPQGTEFRVNTFTANEQRYSSVAMDADGEFVATWTSYAQDGIDLGVYAQRYNAAGVPQGAEFRVNTYTTGHQVYSTVAMDADGDFVITWSSQQQDGSDWGVYAQRYNATGVPQGAEFRVNTYTTGHQIYSTVAMDADGDFVVTWSSDGQEGYGLFANEGVFAQRYNAAGVPQGSEFRVNTYTNGNQTASCVAMDADGDFVVTWSSFGQDDGANGIFAQRYNAAGVRQGSEFQVNTYTTSPQSHPSVTTDADGDFVIAWQSDNQDGNVYGIYAQRYSAAGAALGSEFQVNTHTPGNQAEPRVAMNADGDFVVAWSSSGQDGSGVGIYAQQYDAAGAAVGGEFRVNTHTPGNQAEPRVAMNTDGDFVVAWSSGSQDGSSYGIFAQRYTSSQFPVIAPQTFAIAENRPIGHVVGTVVASDPDAGQTLAYAITSGDPNGQFAINATTGQITVAKATISYEANSHFNLTVRVTDNRQPNPLSSSATIRVDILDLNEAPTFLAPTTFAISENRPVGYVVGTVNTVDPEGNTITYSIVGGDPSAQFAINASTGVITVAKATINFETTPQFVLQIKAQDDGSPANSRTQGITVNVLDLNEAPTFLAPTTFSISENRPVGHVVGTVSTFDPEENTVTYSIVGGDPNAQFAINSATGQITVAKSTINYEATPQFLLQVKAQDNGSPANSRTQTITANILDLNEAPTFLAPTTFTIAENSPNGSVVGTVKTSDPEGNTVTYSITAGNTNNAFAINAGTGQITVANSAALDFETTPQFLLSVKAQDNGSPANSRTQTITINLTDIVGARAPAKMSTRSRTISTPRGSATGQQVIATLSSPPVSGRQRMGDASHDASSELYSFRLYEPLTVALCKNEIGRFSTVCRFEFVVD